MFCSTMCVAQHTKAVWSRDDTLRYWRKKGNREREERALDERKKPGPDFSRGGERGKNFTQPYTEREDEEESTSCVPSAVSIWILGTALLKTTTTSSCREEGTPKPRERQMRVERTTYTFWPKEEKCCCSSSAFEKPKIRWTY